MVVRVNEEIVYAGHVEGHDSGNGWPALMQAIAYAGSKAQKVERRVLR